MNYVNQCGLELNLKNTNDSRGAQIRSKPQWIAEGERNTKYFLTLEKKSWSTENNVRVSSQ